MKKKIQLTQLKLVMFNVNKQKNIVGGFKWTAKPPTLIYLAPTKK